MKTMEIMMNSFMEEVLKQEDQIETRVARQACHMKEDDLFLYRREVKRSANMFMRVFVRSLVGNCRTAMNVSKETEENMIKLIDIIF